MAPTRGRICPPQNPITHSATTDEATLDLTDKVAIVTGGTRGIGRAIVERFCKAGASVVLTGRNAQAGAEMARQSGAHFLPADARDPDHAAGIVAAAMERFGRIDILINNAGHSGPKESFERFDAEEFEKAIAVLLRAPWELSALCAAPMRAAGGGAIVNIASLAGHRVGAASISYAIAKAALIHLTRYGAAELGKDNIRVNSISPGFVATEIHTAALDLGDERAEAMNASLAKFFAARQGLPTIGQSEDIAEAALFLASDAARFVSGADLVIDGALMWGQNGLR